MKKVLQRIIAIVCMMALTVAVLPAAGLRAELEGIGIPKISVKAVNGTDVEVTIGKTEEAEGYEVWITSDCGYTWYKKENSEFGFYNYYDNPGDYINAATVEEDGTAVRTVTIKNLSKARVSVKVRAYIFGYNNRKEYGYFSKEKTVKVTAQKKGYKSSYDFSEVKIGDTIKFGTYEQDYPVNGKDPIEWVVLDKAKSGIVVMSKYALDWLPYNIESRGITWENCTLRKWLNEKFYNAAFNKTEKAMIRKTTVHNNNNPYYDSKGGSDTKDKVFLLSIEDVLKESYGFDMDETVYDINRRCAPSRYAVAQGALHNEDYVTADNEGPCWWWLRSPSSRRFSAVCVSSGGYVYDCGLYPDPDIGIELGLTVDAERGVRPVMVLELKS